jgi:hypothetical protein
MAHIANSVKAKPREIFSIVEIEYFWSYKVKAFCFLLLLI